MWYRNPKSPQDETHQQHNFHPRPLGLGARKKLTAPSRSKMGEGAKGPRAETVPLCLTTRYHQLSRWHSCITSRARTWHRKSCCMSRWNCCWGPLAECGQDDQDDGRTIKHVQNLIESLVTSKHWPVQLGAACTLSAAAGCCHGMCLMKLPEVLWLSDVGFCSLHGIWSSLQSSSSQLVLIVRTAGGVQHVWTMWERRRAGTFGA